MASSGLETTAAELLRDSQLIAQEFLKTGLKTDDVIGIYGYNSNTLTTIIVAATLCGTPWNAVYPEYEKEQLKELFGLTTPKIICCDVENYETLKAALTILNLSAIVYTINGKIPDVLSIEELLLCSKDISSFNCFPGLELNSDATAAILFSSGTTGNSKGVLVSHGALLNTDMFEDVNTDSVTFNLISIFWVTGILTLFESLLNGCKRIVHSQLSIPPEDYLNLLQNHKVTQVLTSTAFITKLVNEAKTAKDTRLNSVYCLSYGGSKVPITIAENLYKMFDANNKSLGPLIGYGFSELAITVSRTPADSNDFAKRRYESVGKLVANIQARIMDSETGALLGPNETGIIMVRSPLKWAGYYRNAAATEEIYKNGWLNTGDLGYFDDEGYLVICVREKEIFKSHCYHFNHHINPNYLEDLLRKMPGVAEVCIFGVPDPIALNFIACAIVRSKDNEGAKLNEVQVVEYVKKHAQKEFQITGGVHFVENLPKGATGKLQRRKVPDLVKKCF